MGWERGHKTGERRQVKGREMGKGDNNGKRGKELEKGTGNRERGREMGQETGKGMGIEATDLVFSTNRCPRFGPQKFSSSPCN